MKNEGIPGVIAFLEQIRTTTNEALRSKFSAEEIAEIEKKHNFNAGINEHIAELNKHLANGD